MAETIKDLPTKPKTCCIFNEEVAKYIRKHDESDESLLRRLLKPSKIYEDADELKTPFGFLASMNAIAQLDHSRHVRMTDPVIDKDRVMDGFVTALCGIEYEMIIYLATKGHTAGLDY